VTASSTPRRTDPLHQIAELLAWCRRLSVTGPGADPTERASYLAAKTDLLTRLADPDPHTSHHHDHDDHDDEQEQR
jgi:hypothetical protein